MSQRDTSIKNTHSQFSSPEVDAVYKTRGDSYFVGSTYRTFALMIKLIFVTLMYSQVALGESSQGSTHQLIQGELNELLAVTKVFNEMRSHSDNNTKTYKYFEQVYLRGTSVTQKIVDSEENLNLKESDKKGFQRQLHEAKEISKVNFYEINKEGKLVPNSKDLHLSALDFFRINNPQIYQDLFSRFLKEGKGTGNMGVGLTPLTYNPTRRTRVINWTKMFAQQLFSFSAAQLILSTGTSFTLSNPVGLQQSIQSVKDPYGIASFAGFVWGHQKTNQILSAKTPLPPSLTNFVGMGVGMLLSSTLYELFIDTDLRECWLSNNENACYAAGERWLTRDKYVGYLPEIVSLGISAAGSHSISSGLIRGIQKTLSRENALKFVNTLRTASLFSLPGLAVNTANFVIFLGLHHMVSPVVQHFWDPFNFNHLGWQLSEEHKKDKPKAATYIRSYQKNESEMEWLKNNIEELLDHKYNYDTCMEEESLHKRSLTMIEIAKDTCERRGNPSLIIETDYAFEKASDKLLIRSFEEKQMNWNLLLASYAEVYGVSKKIYRLIRDAKLKEISLKTKADDPQSKESLEKFYEIAANVFSEQNLRSNFDKNGFTKNGFTASETTRPKSINGVNVKSLIDYILYNMACGSDVEHISYQTQDEENFVNISGVEMIKTPLGSSLEFIPPRITPRDPRICTNRSTRVFRLTKNYKDIQEKIKNGNDVYVGGWHSSLNQKEYPNLFSYIFENINDDFLYTEESSDEFIWWNEKVETPTVKVWQQYESTYKELIKIELLPKLFGYEYRVSKDSSIYQKVKAEINSWIDSSLEPSGSDFMDSKRLGITEQNFNSEEPSTDSAEIGLIEKSYQRLEEDTHLLIDLAKENRILSSQMEDNLNHRLRLMREEMNYHKNMLQVWNNSIRVYPREENLKSFIKEILLLSKSISKEIIALTLIEVDYTDDEIKYLYERLKCEHITTHKEQFPYALSFLLTTPNKKEESDITPNSTEEEVQDSLTRFDGQLTCEDLQSVESTIRNEYESFIEANHISGLMLSINQVTNKRIVDYMSLLTLLTRNLGF